MDCLFPKNSLKKGKGQMFRHFIEPSECASGFAKPRENGCPIEFGRKGDDFYFNHAGCFFNLSKIKSLSSICSLIAMASAIFNKIPICFPGKTPVFFKSDEWIIGV